MVSCVYCGEKVNNKELCCTSCGRAIPAYLKRSVFADPIRKVEH